MTLAKIKRTVRNLLLPSIPYLEHQNRVLFNEIEQLNKKILELIQVDECLSQKNEQMASRLYSNQEEIRVLEDKYYLELYSSWSCYGDELFLIDRIKASLHSPYCWGIYKPEYWMICFSILLKLNEPLLVKKFLSRYIDLHGISIVHRYLIVASFMYQNGFTDDILKKAYVVNAELKDNRDARIIEKYFAGKTVAIVGNGASEIGTNNGSEIDSHDIVIRFNNYQTVGYEHDYGFKTNIWVRGSGGDDIIDRKDVSSYELIIWEADYDHFPVHFDDLDILHRYLSDNVKCCNFDFDEHLSLREASGIDFPSTGLLTIWVVANLVGVENIKIYGFSFKENNPSYINEHYFNDRELEESKGRSSVHNMSQESKFILELLSARHLNKNL